MSANEAKLSRRITNESLYVVRNIYSYKLDADRLTPLAEGAMLAFTQVSQELTEFAQWLLAA